jgi:hypothetical protein
MAKQKVYRSYATAAITSLAWTHVGDQVYAGSRNGEVYCAQLDKQTCVVLFNSNASDEDSPAAIAQLSWLPPQGTMGAGCLFALLDLSTADDTVRECLIGLAPLGKSGKLSQLLMVLALADGCLLQVN